MASVSTSATGSERVVDIARCERAYRHLPRPAPGREALGAQMHAGLSLPLHIAYVVTRFDAGGLERCVAHLCNLLDRGRFLPSIYCLDRAGAALDWLTPSDVHVCELHKRPGNDPGVVLRLARALRAAGTDIVHSQNWGTLVETTVARALAGTRWHVHGEQGLELDELAASGVRGGLHAMATRWAYGRADVLVAVADWLKRRMLERCGPRPERVHVVANGVTACVPTRIDNPGRCVRERLGLGEHAVVIGSVGRLAPVKDFGSAVAALGLLVERGFDAHLMLVGDGAEHARLQRLGAELGLERRLHLVGARADVADHLAAMDIYLNSSISEGTSLSVMEAMAGGLPLVVTRAGDNEMLVGAAESCGLMVAVGDAGSMADALASLLVDPGKRRRMGDAARQRHAVEYTAQRMVERYQALYGSLAGDAMAG